jgi:hypothetical protein
VHDIQKNNTNDEIIFHIDINMKKKKSHEDYVELSILYFI